MQGIYLKNKISPSFQGNDFADPTLLFSHCLLAWLKSWRKFGNQEEALRALSWSEAGDEHHRAEHLINVGEDGEKGGSQEPLSGSS